MNTSRGRLMQTSVTRGLSQMGRRGASVCVKDDELSSPIAVSTLVSRGGARFRVGARIDVPRDDHLDSGALIRRDGGCNVDRRAKNGVDHLRTALRI